MLSEVEGGDYCADLRRLSELLVHNQKIFVFWGITVKTHLFWSYTKN